MQNMGGREPGEPASLQKDTFQNKLMPYLYILVSIAILVFIGVTMDIKKQIKTKNIKESNVFRFSCVALTITVLIGIYLSIQTRGQTNKSQRMVDDYPFFAYSMTFAALAFAITSLLVCFNLFGPLGLIFYIAAWVCFWNAMLVLPF